MCTCLHLKTNILSLCPIFCPQLLQLVISVLCILNFYEFSSKEVVFVCLNIISSVRFNQVLCPVPMLVWTFCLATCSSNYVKINATVSVLPICWFWMSVVVTMESSLLLYLTTLTFTDKLFTRPCLFPRIIFQGFWLATIFDRSHDQNQPKTKIMWTFG